MLRKVLLILFCATFIANAYAIDQALSHRSAEQNSVGSYEPYKFLIGQWNIGADQTSPSFIMRFTWGPNESYIWCSMSMIQNGKEQPHFEGMLVWNGLHKNLDMLFALGLQGPGEQEQGTVSVSNDGVIVREITSVSSEGIQHFRQTFKREGDNHIITTVLRETKDGWVPTFPGSDHLIMWRAEAAS